MLCVCLYSKPFNIYPLVISSTVVSRCGKDKVRDYASQLIKNNALLSRFSSLVQSTNDEQTFSQYGVEFAARGLVYRKKRRSGICARMRAYIHTMHQDFGKKLYLKNSHLMIQSNATCMPLFMNCVCM